MTGSGDYQGEMFRRNDLTDEAIEQILAGRPAPGNEALASFVDEVRATAASPLPEASAALTAIFAEGLSTETTTSSVQTAGIPKRRTKRMIEVLLAKLAAAGLVAKAGLAAGALTLGATAAAATGALPDAAQDPVADGVERVIGMDIPGGSQADAHRQDGDHRDDDAEVEEADVEGNEAETPDQADFGKSVSDRATSGEPQEDGRSFGESVSTEAQQRAATQGQRPAETPTADNNPGTEHRQSAPTSQPEETPTADDNPGSEYRGDAGSQQPENPGAGNRP